MKPVVIKPLLGLLVQSATSSALLQISSVTLLDDIRTVSGDITVNAGSSFMITHDFELTIESGTIANNGTLCVSTTDTVSEMSLNIVAKNINNKGNLIIDNEDSGDKSTMVTIGSLNNGGYLRMNLKDNTEYLSVQASLIDNGYISLCHINNYYDKLTFKKYSRVDDMQNTGTTDVSGTNVTSMVQSQVVIVFGGQVLEFNSTVTYPSYDPVTGIVTTTNRYGTFRIDIGLGYDASNFSDAQIRTCEYLGTCYAPYLRYLGVKPAAATERPTECAVKPDLSMAICSAAVSSSVASSSHSTSSSISVPATSIEPTSSAVTQHTVSKGASSTTNDNGQCVVTEISTEYFSTLHTTTYFYTSDSTVTTPVTSTFITTAYSKVK
ncbi:uncharacterized protein NDAI_0G02800 [Naumovozyma dairenensis CBS 421]|uniref:Hyphally-regulated cell wall protein N-terminal domain-containing protein n=1 Tax=Naumovozyma dairenensis (strain ATCC 10597 / BCRC 20456 / CBS 421 / NBRC 0211 / NRRL Y-12639) TaxID=1071378 RepID=G0WE46_NAUDC|nr:hypothetical protein NDAI_0G02800 [Naumovozyma dairenensis CBS 421]CCD26057.2 hypothetical protein NDAI_0G02800 [Naumovozyma dairenensis CBS 421]